MAVEKNNNPSAESDITRPRVSLLKILGFILLVGSVTSICFRSALISIGL